MPSKKTPTDQSAPNSPASKSAEATNEKVKPLKSAVVSRTGAAAEKKSAPIVFSLDDVEELMAAKKSEKSVETEAAKPVEAKPKVQPTKKIVVDDAPTEKRVHAAASLADILGFNPEEKKPETKLEESEVPKKWKKYYDLLIDLRAHVSHGINLHTSDSLQHGDTNNEASSYESHHTEHGTDSFDRDFALSLVANEQDALQEIEAALLRIKNGTYGICEITGKPIPAARLTAVPFAHYSVEGQAEHEKNQHRKQNRITAGGIFGDITDAPKLESSDEDE
jgi:RNA polymerase-binding transcription factor DksA